MRASRKFLRLKMHAKRKYAMIPGKLHSNHCILMILRKFLQPLFLVAFHRLFIVAYLIRICAIVRRSTLNKL